jgi:hypothetical protein
MAALTGSIYGKETSVLWCPVPAHRPGGDSHDVARMRLNRYAAGFYEELAFNHKIVLTVRMLICPRLRG